MLRRALEAVVGEIAQARAPHPGGPAFGLIAPLVQRVPARAAARLWFTHRSSSRIGARPVPLRWWEQVVEGQQQRLAIEGGTQLGILGAGSHQVVTLAA
jgi:hypothetical protein